MFLQHYMEAGTALAGKSRFQKISRFSVEMNSRLSTAAISSTMVEMEYGCARRELIGQI